MRYATVPAELRDRPFTTATAGRAGISPDALQSPVWRQLFRNVWVHASVEDSREMRLAAARLLLPPYAVLCTLTAAWVRGADVRPEDDLDVHVSYPKGQRRRSRPGLIVVQETLEPEDVCEIDGVLVTTPVRTAFDCLRLLRGAERVVAVDALLHLQHTSVDEVRQYFEVRHGPHRWRNIRRGELLLDDLEPLSESPMESRMRLQLVASGLPRPVAQYEVKRHDELVGRVDLAYVEQKVAIEYDGAWHWKQRVEDERRRARLRAMGWIVLVYVAEDVFRNPMGMAAEVRQALHSRAA
jgi:hypothetical protein